MWAAADCPDGLQVNGNVYVWINDDLLKQDAAAALHGAGAGAAGIDRTDAPGMTGTLSLANWGGFARPSKSSVRCPSCQIGGTWQSLH